ncbi:MAG: transketolase family protein [Kutzneria sp.]|nr:transketolase family protein [Kutzneria sp.]
MGDLDRRAINTVRVLAMDAVQKVGNGHPGTAMSMAPTAYLLFQKWLRHDPSDPNWVGRDRFVLSMGHSSLTLYIQLFLSGYGLELTDLEALRTWGSLTPGHPEVNHTPGVETTTGPLGQGVGNAVGMAMAARRERGLLDADAPEGESVFDHTVWAFASDGDLEEGVSGEASSLAGTQELGNLVLVYDANRISIEDNTDIAFTEGVATRKASGEVLAALYPVLPELWGGSADLAESNNTVVEGAASFPPADRQTKMWSGGPYGRTLHFGVREHAMGAIMNGIALHGGTRVYGGTFLTFSDYMRGAVRLAALMQLPVTYVWTHVSIGLGEDGPTHQPVEHYAALRAMPGLDFVRPADANETAVAWRTILEHNDRPAGLSLTRQNLPVFDRTQFASAEGVTRGGYVLAEATGGIPEVILMGTGSEVQIAVAAREALEADGVPTRVVSLPCWEWFAAQDRAYREQVLPPTVRARVSVEAGVPMGWREFVGDAGRIVGLDHFGASAAYSVLYEQFGLTADADVGAARESLAAAAAAPVAPSGPDSAGVLHSPTGDR